MDKTNKVIMNDIGLANPPDTNSYACKNYSLLKGNTDEYNAICDAFRDKINSFKNKIKQLFLNDDGTSRNYATHGKKIDARRYALHQAGIGSDKIFEKRDRSANKNDMCIGILINESDQLGDNEKVGCVKSGVITVAESCAQLGVPCYVMGYSTENGTINHNHYVTWDNTEEERSSLTNLKKGEGSFDGYSIRYFVDEILSSRDEEHKIVFVLSAGLPTQSFEGIDFEEDLKKAIGFYRRKHKIDFSAVIFGNSDERDDVFRRIFLGTKCHFIPDDSYPEAYANIMTKVVSTIVDSWK